MKIRCISLWQPWASLVAVGAKTFETRSWPTDYRGPLAIHAAKRWDGYQLSIVHQNLFKEALRLTPIGPRPLPLGCILCVVNLIGCYSTNHMGPADVGQRDLPFGDFSRGRYAWELELDRRLKTPFPTVGRQGFWTVEIPDDCL